MSELRKIPNCILLRNAVFERLYKNDIPLQQFQMNNKYVLIYNKVHYAIIGRRFIV